MAQGIYKNGEIIKLTYQAVSLLSAAAPTCKVFDEAGASDLVRQSELHSALTAGEKAQGRYHGHFTPDAEGRWTVYILDKNSAGAVTKTYNVCGHNVDSLGDAQVTLESGVKSDALLSQSAIVSSAKSDALVKQSSIISSVKSDALVKQSAINIATASDALLRQSSVISSVKSDALVKQSAINAATASDALVRQSTLHGYISDCKSAVLAIPSPAAVS